MASGLFDHAPHRDPDHRHRWNALVDGNNHQPDRTIRITIRNERIRCRFPLAEGEACLAGGTCLSVPPMSMTSP
ncbi:hypothetical protein [Actinoplanes regularis]|uniref:Uncharacterized protein n=1 Tax=Actinoplanes regularis TaxID=52697 RepID=A0A238WIC9_9ACTN|nr:hypothetical protein [Actinoplanes regularis]GIE84870.1 hypothetical protein Are01nite_13500 [Actinoplanes regularis]SNR46081.1 hypothetical protein SAMN06264365_102556 [Actinoplanes regularis]